MQTSARIIWLLTLVATPTATQSTIGFARQPPRFEDYRVTALFSGSPAPPALHTKMARMFRTELRRQAADGPNFAGHFTVARWGCGSGCVSVAVIDAKSGDVQFAPFSVEDEWKDGHIICGHGSEFELTSELFVAEGRVNGNIGRHYFRWQNRKFSLLHFEAECSM